MKKIIRWGDGVVGCSLNLRGDKLLIKKLYGKSPGVVLFIPILYNFYPDLLDDAEQHHQSRVNPWKVVVNEGVWGAKTFRLQYLYDQEFKYVLTGGMVHVSMYGKLNRNVIFNGWLGDLPPLIAEMAKAYPEMIYDEKIYFETSDVSEVWEEGWKVPGEPSGLKV